ncbi:hypothetical protein PF005_g32989 [Phytophthora fragariae]|uniref:Uncharacterized protein n=1 Tax=Phytophthora fragariae TaxID=53985 RepID=A0A6A3UXQ9_9STRA|nr:hypothetical protein PF003_g13299 [Phytophthora fragariae]KAE8916855.1 hypothetical protein PF009_g32822 [Phytophthora fragariae]KAE8956665.1 hypothetical protein PF011_g31402 [Phytophthora fragariae]KAE9054558.1 hypothetical protein PF010_g32484 [Phytophthora fragariae]KAE9055015.1 hypothetical protein PF007_g32447 [Phytophthora fragariae]
MGSKAATVAATTQQQRTAMFNGPLALSMRRR